MRMRKFSIVMIYFVSLGVLAQPNKDNSIKESLEAIMLSKEFNLSGTTKVKELKKCSNEGNLHCSTYLGEYYINEKSYSLAYPLLLKASEDNAGSIPPATMANFYLGQMFYKGLGVLQDYNKAINYFEKAAKQGDSKSALLIAIIHTKDLKSLIDKPKEYDYHMIQSYVWLKISQALQSNPLNADESIVKTTPILIKQSREYLVSASRLQEAEQLSKQICKTIPHCKY